MRLAEVRSLVYHQAVAERLRREPDLLVTIREKVVVSISNGGRARPYAEEWLRILDAGLEAVLHVLQGSSERAIDLRHASPFAGLISPRERWRLWKSTHHDPRAA